MGHMHLQTLQGLFSLDAHLFDLRINSCRMIISSKDKQVPFCGICSTYGNLDVAQNTIFEEVSREIFLSEKIVYRCVDRFNNSII